MSYLMGGYLLSFEPHIQFLSFSNGKHTSLLFTVAKTHFQMSAGCFFNLQVSSVEIGLGLYLNIWLYRTSVSLWINVSFRAWKLCAVNEIFYYSKWGNLVQNRFAALSHNFGDLKRILFKYLTWIRKRVLRGLGWHSQWNIPLLVLA